MKTVICFLIFGLLFPAAADPIEWAKVENHLLAALKTSFSGHQALRTHISCESQLGEKISGVLEQEHRGQWKTDKQMIKAIREFFNKRIPITSEPQYFSCDNSYDYRNLCGRRGSFDLTFVDQELVKAENFVEYEWCE